MSGYIDSSPVFVQRCRDIGFDAGQVRKIALDAGFDTMAKFAYSCGFVPGSPDESALVKLAKDILGGGDPSMAELGLFRRLFFESFTLVQADLRHKIERTEDTPARKLAVPERAARFRAQQLRLTGMVLTGELECADALIDQCVAQYDENRLRYVSWDKCLNKAAEMDGAKKDSSISKGLGGALKMVESETYPDADTSNELLLKNALLRRALAYDQSFTVHTLWIEKLFAARMRPPITGYGKVSIEQLERADRALFLKMAELTRDGIVPDATGTKPLDAAMTIGMLDHDVNNNLAQLQKSSSSSSSHTLRDNKRLHDRNTMDSKWQPSKKAKKDKGKGKDTGKSKGSGKPGARLPQGLQGTSKTPDDANICFGYNLGTCQHQGAGCQRGKHCCTKCYGSHPFSACP